MRGQPVGDRFDERRAGDHADLDRHRRDVLEHRVDLVGQDRRVGVLHGAHAGGVLRRQRRDGGHAEHAIGQHRLQIGLDACTARGIRSGDRQHRRQAVRLLDVEHGGTALQGSGHIRLRMGGRRRRNAVPGVPAHGGPCLDQFAGGTFRIVRGGDRRDHEPSIGCGPGQRRHVVRVHAAADHHRIPARLAQQLRPRDAERVLGAVRFDRGRIRLGGGVMQRSRADIVDGAARQRIGGLDVRQGFGGQADDGVGAEQGAGLSGSHIILADVHAVDLDAEFTALPGRIDAVVDDERHGVRLAGLRDDGGDRLGHRGQIAGVGVLGAQLDEGRAPTQRRGDDIGHRTALGVIGAYDEVGTQVEAVAHCGVGETVHRRSFPW